MVEPLKELNQICQKPRYKEVGNWMVRNILRDLALPLTWLLLHTPVTANQVTLVSLIAGLIGVFCMALPSGLSFLTGVLLLQFWYLLDHVDGQIARYRKTACLSGRFYDFVVHHIIHGVILFGLGFYVYNETQNMIFLIWGFAASIAMMMFNLTHDTKHKTFYEKLLTMQNVDILSGASDHAAKNPELKSSGWKRRTFSLLHKVSEVHVMMNILTAGALLQILLFKGLDFRGGLFVFYGLVIPVLSIVKNTHMILARKVDHEFQETFHGNNRTS